MKKHRTRMRGLALLLSMVMLFGSVIPSYAQKLDDPVEQTVNIVEEEADADLTAEEASAAEDAANGANEASAEDAAQADAAEADAAQSDEAEAAGDAAAAEESADPETEEEVGTEATAEDGATADDAGGAVSVSEGHIAAEEEAGETEGVEGNAEAKEEAVFFGVGDKILRILSVDLSTGDLDDGLAALYYGDSYESKTAEVTWTGADYTNVTYELRSLKNVNAGIASGASGTAISTRIGLYNTALDEYNSALAAYTDDDTDVLAKKANVDALLEAETAYPLPDNFSTGTTNGVFSVRQGAATQVFDGYYVLVATDTANTANVGYSAPFEIKVDGITLSNDHASHPYDSTTYPVEFNGSKGYTVLVTPPVSSTVDNVEPATFNLTIPASKVTSSGVSIKDLTYTVTKGSGSTADDLTVVDYFTAADNGKFLWKSGDAVTVTVTPKTGLDIGKYTGYLRVFSPTALVNDYVIKIVFDVTSDIAFSVAIDKTEVEKGAIELTPANGTVLNASGSVPVYYTDEGLATAAGANTSADGLTKYYVEGFDLGSIPVGDALETIQIEAAGGNGGLSISKEGTSAVLKGLRGVASSATSSNTEATYTISGNVEQDDYAWNSGLFYLAASDKDDNEEGAWFYLAPEDVDDLTITVGEDTTDYTGSTYSWSTTGGMELSDSGVNVVITNNSKVSLTLNLTAANITAATLSPALSSTAREVTLAANDSTTVSMVPTAATAGAEITVAGHCIADSSTVTLSFRKLVDVQYAITSDGNLSAAGADAYIGLAYSGYTFKAVQDTGIIGPTWSIVNTKSTTLAADLAGMVTYSMISGISTGDTLPSGYVVYEYEPTSNVYTETSDLTAEENKDYYRADTSYIDGVFEALGGTINSSYDEKNVSNRISAIVSLITGMATLKDATGLKNAVGLSLSSTTGKLTGTVVAENTVDDVKFLVQARFSKNGASFYDFVLATLDVKKAPVNKALTVTYVEGAKELSALDSPSIDLGTISSSSQNGASATISLKSNLGVDVLNTKDSNVGIVASISRVKHTPVSGSSDTIVTSPLDIQKYMSAIVFDANNSASNTYITTNGIALKAGASTTFKISTLSPYEYVGGSENHLAPGKYEITLSIAGGASCPSIDTPMTVVFKLEVKAAPKIVTSAAANSGAADQFLIDNFASDKGFKVGTKVETYTKSDSPATDTYSPKFAVEDGGSGTSFRFTSPWTAAAGSEVPAGLTLTPEGLITGTPTKAGTFVVNITATSTTDATYFATMEYKIIVAGGVSATVSINNVSDVGENANSATLDDDIKTYVLPGIVTGNSSSVKFTITNNSSDTAASNVKISLTDAKDDRTETEIAEINASPANPYLGSVDVFKLSESTITSIAASDHEEITLSASNVAKKGLYKVQVLVAGENLLNPLAFNVLLAVVDPITISDLGTTNGVAGEAYEKNIVASGGHNITMFTFAADDSGSNATTTKLSALGLALTDSTESTQVNGEYVITGKENGKYGRIHGAATGVLAGEKTGLVVKVTEAATTITKTGFTYVGPGATTNGYPKQEVTKTFDITIVPTGKVKIGVDTTHTGTAEGENLVRVADWSAPYSVNRNSANTDWETNSTSNNINYDLTEGIQGTTLGAGFSAISGYKFASLPVGYAQKDLSRITATIENGTLLPMTNSGAGSYAAVSVPEDFTVETLTNEVDVQGNDVKAFDIAAGTSSGNTVIPGKSTFTVVPKTGLAAGTHNGTVTFTNANMETVSFSVSFTVEARTYDAEVSYQTPAGSAAGDEPVVVGSNTSSTKKAITLTPQAKGAVKGEIYDTIIVENTGNSDLKKVKIAEITAIGGTEVTDSSRYSLYFDNGRELTQSADLEEVLTTQSKTTSVNVYPLDYTTVGSKTAYIRISYQNGLNQVVNEDYEVNWVIYNSDLTNLTVTPASGSSTALTSISEDDAISQAAGGVVTLTNSNAAGAANTMYGIAVQLNGENAERFQLTGTSELAELDSDGKSAIIAELAPGASVSLNVLPVKDTPAGSYAVDLLVYGAAGSNLAANQNSSREMTLTITQATSHTFDVYPENDYRVVALEKAFAQRLYNSINLNTGTYVTLDTVNTKATLDLDENGVKETTVQFARSNGTSTITGGTVYHDGDLALNLSSKTLRFTLTAAQKTSLTNSTTGYMNYLDSVTFRPFSAIEFKADSNAKEYIQISKEEIEANKNILYYGSFNENKDAITGFYDDTNSSNPLNGVAFKIYVQNGTSIDAAFANGLPAMTCTGYVFDGWQTTTGEEVGVTTRATKNSTLMRHWFEYNYPSSDDEDADVASTKNADIVWTWTGSKSTGYTDASVKVYPLNAKDASDRERGALEFKTTGSGTTVKMDQPTVVAATCTRGERTVYKASLNHSGNVYTSTISTNEKEAPGHQYAVYSVEWLKDTAGKLTGQAKITLKCTVDSEETSVTVNAVKDETTAPATCTEAGTTYYTIASFTADGKTYSVATDFAASKDLFSTTESVAALGHTPVFKIENFNVDTLTADVTVTCSVCGTELYKGKLKATENSDGSFHFAVPETEYVYDWFDHAHVWGEPVWDYKLENGVVTGFATFTCTPADSTIPSHTHVENARVSSPVVLGIYREYVLTVTGPDEKTYTKTVQFDAEGKDVSHTHAWSDPVWDYTVANGAVTGSAKFTCTPADSAIAAHEVTITATVSDPVAQGEYKVFTLTVQDPAGRSYTKEVTLDAEGNEVTHDHVWGAPVWTSSVADGKVTAVAKFTCTPADATIAPHDVSVSASASIEAGVYKDYTLSVAGPDGQTYSTTVTIDSAGKIVTEASAKYTASWDVAGFDFAKGTGSIVVTLTGDKGDVNIMTAEVTSKTSSKGVITYTASITDNAQKAHTNKWTYDPETGEAKEKGENSSGEYNFDDDAVEDGTFTASIVYPESAVDESFDYTGYAIKPQVIVNNGEKTLVEGTDYSLKYKNNTNAGTGEITVTGKGVYSKSLTLTFKINAINIDSDDVQVGNLVYKTNTKDASVKPVVSYMGKKLTLKKDYTIAAADDQSTADEGTKIFTITGGSDKLKNFTGTRDVVVSYVASLPTFKADIAKGTSFTYDGTAHTLNYDGDGTRNLTLTDTKAKKEFTDEQLAGVHVTYSDNVNLGTCKVLITADGFSGSVAKSFKITAPAVTIVQDADNAEALKSVPYVNTGAKPYVKLVVADGEESGELAGTELVLGRDYKVAWSANKALGTGKAKITFLGNYKGNKSLKEVPFTIVQNTAEPVVSIPVSVTLNAKKAVAGSHFLKAGKNLQVSVNGTLLKTSEYTVEYLKGETVLGSKDAIAAGDDIAVRITPKGNAAKFYDFNGSEEGASFTTTETYTIVDGASKTDLSSAKVKFLGADDKNAKIGYTGTAIMLGKTKSQMSENKLQAYIQLTANKAVIADADMADLEVTYVNNIQKGKATVIISAGADNEKYVGSCSATFTIGAHVFTANDLSEE